MATARDAEVAVNALTDTLQRSNPTNPPLRASYYNGGYRIETIDGGSTPYGTRRFQLKQFVLMVWNMQQAAKDATTPR